MVFTFFWKKKRHFRKMIIKRLFLKFVCIRKKKKSEKKIYKVFQRFDLHLCECFISIHLKVSNFWFWFWTSDKGTETKAKAQTNKQSIVFVVVDGGDGGDGVGKSLIYGIRLAAHSKLTLNNIHLNIFQFFFFVLFQKFNIIQCHLRSFCAYI